VPIAADDLQLKSLAFSPAALAFGLLLLTSP
jgi:hypothetical protein